MLIFNPPTCMNGPFKSQKGGELVGEGEELKKYFEYFQMNEFFHPKL